MQSMHEDKPDKFLVVTLDEEAQAPSDRRTFRLVNTSSSQPDFHVKTKGEI